MCWSPEISLLTFGVVSVVCTMFLRRDLPNDLLLAIFIFSYGLMQLFETFMWWGQPCTILNKIGSFCGCVLLYTHVLTLTIGIRYDKNYKDLDMLTKDFLLFIGMMVLMFGFYRIATDRTHHYCSKPNCKDGHLFWDFPTDYIHLILPIAVIIALIFVRPFSIMLPTIGFFLITLYIAKKHPLTYGSLWCWMVAFFSFFVYAINSIQVLA